MALTNFMFKDSYVTISRLVFEKDINHISCTLKVMSADKKQAAIREVHASGSKKFLSICLGVLEPPSNPAHEDAYLLQGDLRGVWKNYPSHIASWDMHRKDWNYWAAYSWHEPLYLEDSKEYVHLVDGNIIKGVTCYDDIRVWDRFFSPEALKESNHIKQFYLYLKSLDEFKDCVDC